jgi:FemAB-related protein (PEP-CTERM system-associated)
MQCPRCQQDNQSHAKFCLACGIPVSDPTSQARTYSELKREIEGLQRSLGEALERQTATATSEILSVIANSLPDLQPVMDAGLPAASRMSASARAVAGAECSVDRSEELRVERAEDPVSGEWNQFVERAPDAELYHDFRWRALVQRIFGHEAPYLMARDGAGAVAGVLPLVRLRSRLFGDFVVSLPYFNYGGVLASTPSAARTLVAAAERYARDCNADHVELRHRTPLDVGLPVRESKVTMLLDLPGSEGELWSGLKAKLRSQIRRPEKEGATVREGSAGLLDDFYSVFARNMRDLGTPVYSKRFFAAILSFFAERSRVIVVYLDGRPMAAGLMLAHRSTLEIPWASSIREGNRVGLNMLLYWSALRYAVRSGFRRFDFGRSTKDSGTYRFKEQWGASPQPLHWYYVLAARQVLPDLRPSNPKYRLAVRLWQRLPLPVANLLGPHLVKNLP